MWFFLILFYVGFCSAQSSYKICAYQEDQRTCDSIARGGIIECVNTQDSVDCALKIQSGEVDFGVFQPEQALLLSNFLPDTLGVVADIRIKENALSPNSFETVLVVPKDHQYGLNGLKGKKYCRTDIDENDLWTERVGQEFENAFFKSTGTPFGSCTQDDKSYLVHRLQQLLYMVDDSCRAGTWDDTPNDDSNLKLKDYKSLCKLCTQEKCHYSKSSPDITDPNEYALQCLTSNGYFAFTTLSAVDTFFESNNTQTQMYKLLCRDGSMMDIGTINSGVCSWRNQPWPMILSSNSKIQQLQQDLNNWLPNKIIQHIPAPLNRGFTKQSDWRLELSKWLLSSIEEGLYIYNDTKTISQFLGQNNQTIIFDDDDKCPMNWCTISDNEQQKCLYLSLASRNQGLYPVINCVQGQSTYHCLHKIKNKEADTMTIDSNYGYLARKNNLRNLMYIQEQQSDISTIIALIKNDSTIGSFNDLKNKKACFPEYQGIAWLAFIKTARDMNLFSNSCNYEQLVTSFFSSSCAPGAKDRVYHRAKNTNTHKLCDLCQDLNNNAGYCEANYQNKYFNNNGSLSCLDDTGDIAFVELEAIDWTNIDKSKYKVLCKSGNVQSLDAMDNNCSLMATVDSEIIYRGDDNRRNKYIELLNNMDDLFGTIDRKNQIMEMFKLFNGTKNLMFKSKSLGFDSTENPQNPFVKNYVALFKHVDKCTGAASAIVPSLLFILCLFYTTKLLQMLLS